MSANDEDVFLLNNDPNGLVVKYQKVISIIAQKKLINPGYFTMQEKDDLTQTISKQLIEKIPSIRKNFNGSSKLVTYCSATINNLCNNIIRKLSGQRSFINKLPQDKDCNESIINEIIIDDALDKFENILKLYNKQRKKLEFCLKVYLNVRLSQKDFDYLLSGTQIKPERLTGIFSELSENNISTKKANYKLLTSIFNILEHTDNIDDAIRKWLNKKIREIIDLLNGNPKQACFDEETFQILAERYFDKRIHFNI